MRETDRDLLVTTLEMLVPLRVMELRGAGEAERVRLAREAAQEIASHGDIIMFRGARSGETSRALGHLVTGLAVGAYQPGGIRFMGLGWYAAHPAHRWAGEEALCAECVAAEAAGAARSGAVRPAS